MTSATALASPDLITIYALAKRLGVHRSTVRLVALEVLVDVHQVRGVWFIAAVDAPRLESAVTAWRDRPRLWPRRKLALG